jgi:hypothetical protein
LDAGGRPGGGERIPQLDNEGIAIHAGIEVSR